MTYDTNGLVKINKCYNFRAYHVMYLFTLIRWYSFTKLILISFTIRQTKYMFNLNEESVSNLIKSNLMIYHHIIFILAAIFLYSNKSDKEVLI